jgi:hypothetical protein
MAAGTNAKLPNSAIKAAAKEVADDGADAAPESSGGGFRALVFALVLLDLVALGGFAYLRFKRNGDIEKSIAKADSELARLKRDLVNLDDTVRRIQREKVQQVDDPGTLLNRVATRFGIADSLKSDKPQTIPFAKTAYEETTVRFTFLNRSSYDFAGDQGIMNFFTEVQNANPSIQFKEITFGDRQPGVGNDKWELKGGVVRVLKPKPSTE